MGTTSGSLNNRGFES